MNLTITNILLFTAAFVSGLVILLIKPKIEKNLKLLISFSGAFLFTVCLLHLIPEIYHDYNYKVGLFVLLGFLIQLLLEFFSKGIEHGHYHKSSKNLNFPLALFLSLCVHSFIEGMALTESAHIHLSHNHNHSLLSGILIHKIPISIVLSSVLLSLNISKNLSVFSLLIFAVSAPIGLLTSTYLISNFNFNLNYLLAITLGVFLHISTTILFETSENHKFDIKKLIIILLGIGIATLTTL